MEWSAVLAHPALRPLLLMSEEKGCVLFCKGASSFLGSSLKQATDHRAGYSKTSCRRSSKAASSSCHDCSSSAISAPFSTASRTA